MCRLANYGEDDDVPGRVSDRDVRLMSMDRRSRRTCWRR